MSGYYRKIWYLPILICLALVFALLMASPVSADDGQPVDPPAVEEVTAPPQTDVPPPVVESVPPVEEIVPPVEAVAPVEAPLPTSNLRGEMLHLLKNPHRSKNRPCRKSPPPWRMPGWSWWTPSGTTAPMATRDTSLGVVVGDPYFKVGGTEYHFTAADCDPGSGVSSCPNPIQAALDYMESHNLTPTDRKLYIEADTYNEDVFIGGWLPGVKGLLGLVGLGDYPEDVEINGSISVYEMPAGFTIQNMSVFNGDSDEAAILLRME